MSCLHCGAPLNSDKCDYCGSIVREQAQTQTTNTAKTPRLRDVFLDGLSTVSSNVNENLDSMDKDARKFWNKKR